MEPLTRPTTDPREDLDGFIREVINGVSALSMTPPERPPVVLKGLLDCRELTVQPGPLCPLRDFCATSWTLGQLSGGRVLAAGITRDDLMYTSIFTAAHRQWSTPVLLDLSDCDSSVQISATARDGDIFVMSSDNRLVVVKCGDEGCVVSANYTLSSAPVALAVSPQGDYVAIILKRGRDLQVISVDGRRILTMRLKSKASLVAFNPDASRIGVVMPDKNELIVMVFQPAVHSLSPIVVLDLMPPPEALLKRHLETKQAPRFDVDEAPEWLDLYDAEHGFVFATRHHMSSDQHVIMDNACAVAALRADGFTVILDATGAVTLLDEEWVVRHALPRPAPVKIGHQTTQACLCETCVFRSLQVPSTGCHPVLLLSADQRALLIVDQWATVRCCSALPMGPTKDDN